MSWFSSTNSFASPRVGARMLDTSWFIQIIRCPWISRQLESLRRIMGGLVGSGWVWLAVWASSLSSLPCSFASSSLFSWATCSINVFWFVASCAAWFASLALALWLLFSCFSLVFSFSNVFIVRRAGLLWSQQDFEWRWSVPLFKCLTVLEFSFILFDLCLLITFFNFIMNYVPIVTFWIFTYHKIWILSIMFCFIWSYWIIYFLACLEVSWRVVS